MCEVKLIAKQSLGNGNSIYTYQCFCSPKPIKEIVFAMSNDNEANTYAQFECDAYCSSDQNSQIETNEILSGLCKIKFINLSLENRYFFYYQANQGSYFNFCEKATLLGVVPPNSYVNWYIEQNKVLFVNIYKINSCNDTSFRTFYGNFTELNCDSTWNFF